MNAHQRLLEAMKNVRYVQKDGQTDFGDKYKYVSHDKVINEVRQHLIEAGLVMVVNITDENVEILQGIDEKGKTKHTIFTRIRGDVEFVNADEPQDRVIYRGLIGYALDRQDKGAGKAMSYLKKYGLLIPLLLETGDDIEKDNLDYGKGGEKSVKISAYESLVEFATSKSVFKWELDCIIALNQGKKSAEELCKNEKFISAFKKWCEQVPRQDIYNYFLDKVSKSEAKEAIMDELDKDCPEHASDFEHNWLKAVTIYRRLA